MKQRILLGMSGGTDSSVAAILLLEQGYEVVGITFRFWEEKDSLGACFCSRDYRPFLKKQLAEPEKYLPRKFFR